MRNLHFILLPLIAITLLACSEDGSNPAAPAETQVLMPLAIGNYWVYKEYHFDPSGALSYSHRDTILIKDTFTDSAGVLWYGVGLSPARNSDIGLHIGFDLYTFKYPATLGDRTPFTEYPDVFLTVTNIDTAITTPSGVYRCIKYSGGKDNSPNYVNFYFCPGIGQIRDERKASDTSYNEYSELIEYHLE